MADGKKVVLGLVTTKSPRLENKDTVIARIHEAEKYIPLERLCLSPQCGFASCEIGNKLTELEQWNKLKLVKEIAETTNVSINTSLGRMRYAILNLRRMAKEHHISLQLD